MQEGTKILKWFAARAITERSYVLKYLERAQADAVASALPPVAEIVRISDIPNLIFIHCSEAAVEKVMQDLSSRVFFYRDPSRRHPQAIPEGEMRTFQLLAPYHDQPVIYIPVEDPAFLEGTRYRVTAGEFKDCIGTLKRYKGEKRLIIKLSDHAAIATPHIPAVLLEDIDNPIPKAEIKSVFRSMLPALPSVPEGNDE